MPLQKNGLKTRKNPERPHHNGAPDINEAMIGLLKRNGNVPLSVDKLVDTLLPRMPRGTSRDSLKSRVRRELTDGEEYGSRKGCRYLAYYLADREVGTRGEMLDDRLQNAPKRRERPEYNTWIPLTALVAYDGAFTHSSL